MAVEDLDSAVARDLRRLGELLSPVMGLEPMPDATTLNHADALLLCERVHQVAVLSREQDGLNLSDALTEIDRLIE